MGRVVTASSWARVMPADAKKRLISNIVGSWSNTPKRIQELQVQHFFKADPAYGEGVAKGLGLDVSKLAEKEISHADRRS